MRTLPDRYSSSTVLAILFLTLHQWSYCQACFKDVKPLTVSSVWVQTTGVQSYLQYEAQPLDVITVTPRGRDKSQQKTLQCLKSYPSSNKVLVNMQETSPDTKKTTSSFLCLRFDVLSRQALRLYRTLAKGSADEVDCDTDTYNIDASGGVLVGGSHAAAQPCPLHGSFQAMLHNPQQSHRTSMSVAKCMATINFDCNNQNVVATFGTGCKPPTYGFHQTPKRLSCVGNWSVGGQAENEDGYKTIVMSNIDENRKSSEFEIWCLHYKTPRKSSFDNLQVHLSFDGRCSSLNPFSNKKSENDLSRNTMHGHIARFVPPRDSRCSDKSHVKSCEKRNVVCSESNACPSHCGRCYAIPKAVKCQLNQQSLGRWEVNNSMGTLSLEVGKDGIDSSRHGKYVCRKSNEESKFYTNPVMQYDPEDEECMPVYACMNIYSTQPGVSTFYLRRTATNPKGFTSGKIGKSITSCEETNKIFKDNRVPEGEAITLVKKNELKPTPCDFGDKQQFNIFRGKCLFNVEECSGKSCLALNVSYDNDTCQRIPPILPIAREHTCYARVKLPDQIQGLVTYSPELGKYLCWFFTARRVFVTELHMCNDEAVFRIFSDIKAHLTYDPIKMLTIPAADKEEVSPASSPHNSPHLCLTWLCFVFSVLVLTKSVLV